MSGSPWETLQLSGATADRRSIQRAYAAELKRFKVDDEPARFEHLRAAYEHALASAQEATESAESPEPVYWWQQSASEDRDEAQNAASADAAGSDRTDDEPMPPGCEEDTVPESEVAWIVCGELRELIDEVRLGRPATGGAQPAALDGTAAASDPGAVLANQVRLPRWRSARAREVLQACWAEVLLDPEEQPALAPASGQDVQAFWLWSDWVAAVAGHLGWLEHEKLPAAAEPVMAAQMRQLHFLYRWADDEPADARQGLQRWLKRPVWATLDGRARLRLLWQQHLARCRSTQPAGSVSLAEQAWLATVGEAIGLPSTCGDGVKAGARQSSPATEAAPIDAAPSQLVGPDWLHRVASGEWQHPRIHRTIAEALVQPRIRPADRKAARRERDSLENRLVSGSAAVSWQVQVRQAIAWLQTHDPSVLGSLAPDVLNWWRRSHVQDTGVHWFLVLAVGQPGSLYIVASLQRWAGWPPEDKPEWYFAWAVSMGLSYLTLYALLMGLAAVRLLWRDALLPRLARWDKAGRQRLPLLGRPLLKADLWLSRDLVPAIGLLALGWVWYAVLLMWVAWRWLWSLAAQSEVFPLEE